ncbi:MAG TPA: hypothetical protein VFW98_18045, partial [Gemmatimonadaceae bacterium]|nr:hypothetical protein [Gemmatimonadaceae bacterium]
STIPYLLFVIGFVLWTRKPRSDRALRRVPWMAPVIIAVPFALWAASFDLRRLEWSNAWGMVILYGGVALVVGYAYVLPIQLTFLVLKGRGAISA